MNNFKQPGDRITITAGGALTSNQGLLTNDTFGVVAETVASGEEVEVAVKGVYELPKEAPLVIAQGANVYWNNGSSEVTTTAGGNTLIGKAWTAGASADTVIDVNLLP